MYIRVHVCTCVYVCAYVYICMCVHVRSLVRSLTRRAMLAQRSFSGSKASLSRCSNTSSTLLTSWLSSTTSPLAFSRFVERSVKGHGGRWQSLEGRNNNVVWKEAEDVHVYLL